MSTIETASGSDSKATNLAEPIEFGGVFKVALRPPSLEAEYRAQASRSDARSALWLIALIGGLSVTFRRTDVALVHDPELLSRLLWVRVAGVGLSLASIAWLRGARSPRSIAATIFGWNVLTILTNLFAQSTRPADFYSSYAGAGVYVTVCWVLFSNEFGLQLLAAALCTASEWWIAQAFRATLDPSGQRFFVTILAATNLTGLTLSWRAHRVGRTAIVGAYSDLRGLQVDPRVRRELASA